MTVTDISEWNTFYLKMKYQYITSLYRELEVRVLDLEGRLSALESENIELRKKMPSFEPLSEDVEVWLKVRGLAIESKTLYLLNPSKKYKFQVVEVSDDYIRIDKLGKQKLVKDMFVSVYDRLKNDEGWIRIGASVTDTKSDTIEGFLKDNFHGGDMNGPMTAPWISALLVRANIGVEFNNQATGQAIRYVKV
jgi:hypothetical protein